jgi:hypothetical protein
VNPVSSKPLVNRIALCLLVSNTDTRTTHTQNGRLSGYGASRCTPMSTRQGGVIYAGLLSRSTALAFVASVQGSSNGFWMQALLLIFDHFDARYKFARISQAIKSLKFRQPFAIFSSLIFFADGLLHFVLHSKQNHQFHGSSPPLNARGSICTSRLQLGQIHFLSETLSLPNKVNSRSAAWRGSVYIPIGLGLPSEFQGGILYTNSASFPGASCTWLAAGVLPCPIHHASRRQYSLSWRSISSGVGHLAA